MRAKLSWWFALAGTLTQKSSYKPGPTESFIFEAFGIARGVKKTIGDFDHE